MEPMIYYDRYDKWSLIISHLIVEIANFKKKLAQALKMIYSLSCGSVTTFLLFYIDCHYLLNIYICIFFNIQVRK